MILKIILKKLNSGAILLLPILLLAACTKDASKPLSALEARGKSSYMANCSACHNPDPRMVGSVGPEIAGASVELLRAKVLQQTYPPGYLPKRNSKLMPALPFLDKDTEAIHAYLNSFK